MGNRDINWYCRVYDDFLEPQFCAQYVDKFEETITKDSKRHRELSVCYREDGSMICGACDCMRTNPMEYERFSDLNSYLIPKWQEAIDRYKEDVEIHQHQWPEKYGFEAFRLKRYMPNNIDQFPEHVDVLNLKTAKRFLVAFLYLDNNSRGETVINPKDDLFVSFCKQGSLLLFPPMWPWTHEGSKPIDKPKYIIGSYLHYV